MRTDHPLFRIIGVIALVCFIQGVVLPVAARGQTPECPYDRTKPSLDNARISFKSLDYHCAEQEIMDYLNLGNLTIEQRADAHVLLAAVYYAKSKNDSEKKKLVISQFKEAFRAYRDWRGELDISSTEFIEMMNEAKDQVDQEEAQKEEKPVITEPTPAEETPVVTTITPQESKPWYKNWWAIALGVGVVAGAVVLAAGGGSEGGGEGGGGTVTDTLPTAPNPPGTTK
jgi:hypothetical protein